MTVKPKTRTFRATPRLRVAPPVHPPIQPTDKLIYFVPYNKYSKACRALSQIFRRPGQESIPFGHRLSNTDIVNWGNAGNDTISIAEKTPQKVRVFNKISAVSVARNKLKFFEKMLKAKDGPRCPEFTVSLEQAKKWVDAGEIVFGRKKSGSCGLDIVQFDESPGKFSTSDLWTLYKKKKAEYRVHVFRVGAEFRVIDVQQKTLRKTDPVTNEAIDTSKVNFLIRNHRNGFVFQRYDIDVPNDIKVQAVKALDASGLDFGAVDVIWNEHEGKAYVLEVNSAPGLEGTTLDNYVSTFKELFSRD